MQWKFYVTMTVWHPNFWVTAQQKTEDSSFTLRNTSDSSITWKPSTLLYKKIKPSQKNVRDSPHSSVSLPVLTLR